MVKEVTRTARRTGSQHWSELVRRNRVLMATDAGWCREFLLITVS